MIKITLTAGKVGKQETQRKVLTALGLKKFGSTVVRVNSPTIRGMVEKVGHLVCVTEVPAGTPAGKVTRKNRKALCQTNPVAVCTDPTKKKARSK